MLVISEINLFISLCILLTRNFYAFLQVKKLQRKKQYQSWVRVHRSQRSCSVEYSLQIEIKNNFVPLLHLSW